MKVAFFSTQTYDKEYFERYNKYNYQYTYLACELDENTVDLAKDHDAVCVFVNDKVNNNVLAALAGFNIKLVALRCTGFNNVDLDAAKAYNVSVVRVPEYSPHAVAEHAVAMLLTLNRKTHKAYNSIREGDFSLNNLLDFDLYQKNVGVIGAGKIGRAFVKIMLGFGCNVFIYDLVVDQNMVEAGAKYVEINVLFAQSDIISLHCPLNKDTFHIINTESIERMKPGGFIINTSRGAMIDTLAAKSSLKSGKIGYLALDVYEQE